MGLLDGKTVLISGVRDEDSIAFAVAQVAQQQGARVVLTAPARAMPLAVAAASALPEPGVPVIELDVTNSAELAGLAVALRERGINSLDGVVHSIAFAHKTLMGNSIFNNDDDATTIHISPDTSKTVIAGSTRNLDAGAAPSSSVIAGSARNLCADQPADQRAAPTVIPARGASGDTARNLTAARAAGYEQQFERAATAFRTSAYSYHALVQAVLPLLNPGASVVGMSFDARFAWPNYNWMGVNKAALEALNRYMARDLAPAGVRANIVSAGTVATGAALGIPGFKEKMTDGAAKAPLHWDPFNALPVAKATVALLSDWFEMTTGDIIFVDGGAHAVHTWD